LKSDPILAPDLPSFELSQKICQIINQFLPFEEPNPKLFHLLEKSIEAIKTGTRYPKTEIYFLTKFLEFSGFLPSFNFCNQCHQKFDDNPYLNEDFEFYCSKCVPTNQSQEQNQINLSTLKLLNFITTCNRVDQLRPLKIPDQNQSEAKFILEKLVKHQLF
jgi:DNA repair protein RecO